MTPYFNKGHVVFVDIWYSSPPLFDYLPCLETACGKVSKNHKGLNQFSRKLYRGDFEEIFIHNLLFMEKQEKRDVHMLSTIQNSHSIKNSGKKERNQQKITNRQ